MLLTDIAAALLIALLTGMGLGSGGLLVIYLTLITQMAQPLAQGINLVFFLCAGGSALTLHATRRRLYPVMIVWVVLFGLIGAPLGSALAQRISPLLLRRIFGGMLVISGLGTWLRPALQARPGRKKSFR